MCFIRPTDSGRVSKVREFTLYPTLIFPVDKAPAASTPLHGGGGGVCCCSRSTSSCCRRLPPPVPLCCPASASAAADCLLWADLQGGGGITKASRQRLRESRASVSALHKKKVNSSTIEIRVVWSVNSVTLPTVLESMCSFKCTITLQSKTDLTLKRNWRNVIHTTFVPTFLFTKEMQGHFGDINARCILHSAQYTKWDSLYPILWLPQYEGKIVTILNIHLQVVTRQQGNGTEIGFGNWKNSHNFLLMCHKVIVTISDKDCNNLFKVTFSLIEKEKKDNSIRCLLCVVIAHTYYTCGRTGTPRPLCSAAHSRARLATLGRADTDGRASQTCFAAAAPRERPST